ncbi:MAG: hypothetical protein ACOZQL_14650 [Myxococcota bacterium]
MRLLLAFVLVLFPACASSRLAVQPAAGSFDARDYLKTAYETLVSAETDTGGHRIRAQLETRAALDALGDDARHARLVPFDGPPSMEVALELLQASEQQVTQNVLARTHTQRALAELKAALK